MDTQANKSQFLLGMRDSLPFLLVAVPFAAVFGVLASEAGLSVLEALSFSIAVMAGAAQLTAIALLQEQVPTLIILASALAVNLRMAMYSAALTVHLGNTPLWKRALAAYLIMDAPVALGLTKFEAQPHLTPSEKLAYYTGNCILIAVTWFTFTAIGAMIGSKIPENWALDFAVPVSFVAIVAPGLRSLAHVMAALVAVLLSLLLVGIPYGLGLIVAGICGMVVGARTQTWMESQS